MQTETAHKEQSSNNSEILGKQTGDKKTVNNNNHISCGGQIEWKVEKDAVKKRIIDLTYIALKKDVSNVYDYVTIQIVWEYPVVWNHILIINPIIKNILCIS